MQQFRLPILVPLGALIATAVIILTTGLILLWVGDYQWNHSAVGPLDFIRLAVGDYPNSEVHFNSRRWDLGLFDMSAPVIVALLIAVAVLIGSALVARGGRSQG